MYLLDLAVVVDMIESSEDLRTFDGQNSEQVAQWNAKKC